MATVRSDLEIKADARSIKDLGRALKDAFSKGAAAARKMTGGVDVNEKALARMKRNLERTNKELDKLEEGTDEWKALSKEIEKSTRELRKYERALRRLNRVPRPQAPPGGNPPGPGPGGGQGPSPAFQTWARGRNAVYRGAAQMASPGAIGSASATQPLAAGGQIANQIGSAMGQIPFVGWALQLFNSYVGAGMQIAQQRLNSFHQYSESMKSGQFGFDVSRVARGGNWNRWNKFARGSGWSSLTNAGGSMLSPAEHARAITAASRQGGGFVLNEDNYIMAGTLAARGFDPSIWEAGKMFAPGAGTTVGRFAKRISGKNRWRAANNMISGLMVSGAETVSHEAELFYGKGARSRLGPEVVVKLLKQIASYGEDQQRRGVTWNPMSTLALVRGIRQAAFDEKGKVGAINMGPEYFSGANTMSWLNKVEGESRQKGSPLNFLTFMSAMNSGVSTFTPGRGLGKKRKRGLLWALRAARLGVGQGSGQVSHGELVSQTQRMFGRSSHDAPSLADFLLSQDHRFAESLTRIGAPDKLFSGLSTIHQGAGGIIQTHVPWDSYKNFNKAGFKAHQLTPWQKAVNKQQWRDIRKGGQHQGWAIRMLPSINKFQDKLVEFAKANWDKVIAQMDMLNGMVRQLIDGMAMLINGLADIVGYFNSSAAQSMRNFASKLQQFGQGLPTFGGSGGGGGGSPP